jgi:four helix bundle protein
VVGVYRFSQQFPADERFNLTSQIRRSGVSIPSNIAEGHGRRTSKDFSHFLWIANGSLSELETQALVAERLNYATAEATQSLLVRADEVRRIAAGLRSSLNTD